MGGFQPQSSQEFGLSTLPLWLCDFLGSNFATRYDTWKINFWHALMNQTTCKSVHRCIMASKVNVEATLEWTSLPGRLCQLIHPQGYYPSKSVIHEVNWNLYVILSHCYRYASFCHSSSLKPVAYCLVWNQCHVDVGVDQQQWFWLYSHCQWYDTF